ncbi:MAG: hypothetical protein JW893_05755 [Candidatus Omnitrophica bacterium]|nr:hypothetical protein [Candidatus Omnitrophota bacterium]
MLSNYWTKKFVACLILTTFFFTNAIDPSYALTPWKENPFLSKANLSFEIPFDLGEVTERIPVVSSRGVIVHIQTAHGHEEAQLNIEKILGKLQEESRISHLFLEGAANQLQPEIFRIFPEDPELNKKIGETLVADGELTGPELFLLQDSQKAKAWGIEDKNSYRRNWLAFKEVLEGEDSANAFLASLMIEWEKEAAKIFSDKLRKFLEEEGKYEEEKIPLASWLTCLKEKAFEHLKVDLGSFWFQDKWPLLVRYFRLQAIVDLLDSEATQEEKKQFLAVLNDLPLKEELIQEVRKALNPEENKSLKTSLRNLLERLFEVLPEDFSFSRYPALKLDLQYRILMEELQGEKLMEEVERLSHQIMESLTESAEEKELLGLFYDQHLLKKLFRLELSRQEYAEVQTKRESLKPSSFQKRMGKADHSPSVAGDGGLVHQTDPTAGLRSLHPDRLFEQAMEFYEIAVGREEAMIQNTLKKMEEEHTKKGVLITGGFHTEGLKKKILESGYSYLEIMPRIRTFTKDAREIYIRSMIGERAKKNSPSPKPLPLEGGEDKGEGVASSEVESSVLEPAKRLDPAFFIGTSDAALIQSATEKMRGAIERTIAYHRPGRREALVSQFRGSTFAKTYLADSEAGRMKSEVGNWKLEALPAGRRAGKSFFSVASSFPRLASSDKENPRAELRISDNKPRRSGKQAPDAAMDRKVEEFFDGFQGWFENQYGRYGEELYEYLIKSLTDRNRSYREVMSLGVVDEARVPPIARLIASGYWLYLQLTLEFARLSQEFQSQGENAIIEEFHGQIQDRAFIHSLVDKAFKDKPGDAWDKLLFEADLNFHLSSIERIIWMTSEEQSGISFEELFARLNIVYFYFMRLNEIMGGYALSQGMPVVRAFDAALARYEDKHYPRSELRISRNGDKGARELGAGMSQRIEKLFALLRLRAKKAHPQYGEVFFNEVMTVIAGRNQADRIALSQSPVIQSTQTILPKSLFNIAAPYYLYPQALNVLKALAQELQGEKDAVILQRFSEHMKSDAFFKNVADAFLSKDIGARLDPTEQALFMSNLSAHIVYLTNEIAEADSSNMTVDRLQAWCDINLFYYLDVYLSMLRFLRGDDDSVFDAFEAALMRYEEAHYLRSGSPALAGQDRDLQPEATSVDQRVEHLLGLFREQVLKRYSQYGPEFYDAVMRAISSRNRLFRETMDQSPAGLPKNHLFAVAGFFVYAQLIVRLKALRTERKGKDDTKILDEFLKQISEPALMQNILEEALKALNFLEDPLTVGIFTANAETHLAHMELEIEKSDWPLTTLERLEAWWDVNHNYYANIAMNMRRYIEAGDIPTVRDFDAALARYEDKHYPRSELRPESRDSGIPLETGRSELRASNKEKVTAFLAKTDQFRPRAEASLKKITSARMEKDDREVLRMVWAQISVAFNLLMQKLDHSEVKLAIQDVIGNALVGISRLLERKSGRHVNAILLEAFQVLLTQLENLKVLVDRGLLEDIERYHPSSEGFDLSTDMAEAETSRSEFRAFLEASGIVAAASFIFVKYFSAMPFLLFFPVSLVIGHLASSRIDQDKDYRRYVYAALSGIIPAIAIPWYVPMIKLIPDASLTSYWFKPYLDLFLFASVMNLSVFVVMGFRDMARDQGEKFIRYLGRVAAVKAKQIFERGGFFKIFILFQMPIATFNYAIATSFDQIKTIIIVAGMVYSVPMAFFAVKKPDGKSGKQTLADKVLGHSYLISIFATVGWLTAAFATKNHTAQIHAEALLATTLGAYVIVKGVYSLRSLVSGSSTVGEVGRSELRLPPMDTAKRREDALVILAELKAADQTTTVGKLAETIKARFPERYQDYPVGQIADRLKGDRKNDRRFDAYKDVFVKRAGREEIPAMQKFRERVQKLIGLDPDILRSFTAFFEAWGSKGGEVFSLAAELLDQIDQRIQNVPEDWRMNVKLVELADEMILAATLNQRQKKEDKRVFRLDERLERLLIDVVADHIEQHFEEAPDPIGPEKRRAIDAVMGTKILPPWAPRPYYVEETGDDAEEDFLSGDTVTGFTWDDEEDGEERSELRGTEAGSCLPASCRAGRLERKCFFPLLASSL